MMKKAILVVSFGTSYRETRENTIERIEKHIEKRFPEYEVRRAFTSRTVIRILRERDGISVENEKEALARLLKDGYNQVIIQPTHMIHGFEYDKIKKVADEFRECFDSLSLGRPLLSLEEDYQILAQCLSELTREYQAEGTGFLFMGHGSEHPANASYGKLERVLRAIGQTHHAVGTVEGEPDLEQVMKEVVDWKVSRLVLIPLMIVAGDHAVSDMAGDDKDSWKKQLEEKGYEVSCVLKGLGEHPGILDMFVERVNTACAVSL